MSFSVRYISQLALACVIAAVSLIQNSIEGVVASMLISPVGGPILAFSGALSRWDVMAAFSSAVAFCVSVIAMLAIGVMTRAFILRTNPKPSKVPKSSQEIDKRTSSFNYISTFVYAVVIGVAMSTNLPSGFVTSTGLAIAVSILPPLVTSGIMIHDGDYAAARTSASMSAINVLGVVVGSIISFGTVKR